MLHKLTEGGPENKIHYINLRSVALVTVVPAPQSGFVNAHIQFSGGSGTRFFLTQGDFDAFLLALRKPPE